MSAVTAGSVIAQGGTKASEKTWLTGLSLALADVIAVLSAAVLSLLLFQLGHSPWGIVLKQFIPGLATLVAFAVLGLYPVIGLNPALEFQRVILGSAPVMRSAVVLPCGRRPFRGACQAFGRMRAHSGSSFSPVAPFVADCVAICPGGVLQPFSSVRAPMRAPFFVSFSGNAPVSKIVAAFDDKPIDWPELDREQIHISTPEYAAEFAPEMRASRTPSSRCRDLPERRLGRSSKSTLPASSTCL